MRYIAFFLFLALNFTSNFSYALDSNHRLSLGGGYGFGGDSFFAEGSGDELASGTGSSFYIGMHSHLHFVPGTGLGLKEEIGYRSYSDTSSSGRNYLFQVIPINVLVFIEYEGMRFGGGVAYNLLPTLKIDESYSDSLGPVSNTYRYRNSNGYIFALEFGGTRNIPLFIGFRYTMVDYYLADSNEIGPNPPLKSVNGDHASVQVGINF